METKHINKAAETFFSTEIVFSSETITYTHGMRHNIVNIALYTEFSKVFLPANAMNYAINLLQLYYLYISCATSRGTTHEK